MDRSMRWSTQRGFSASFYSVSPLYLVRNWECVSSHRSDTKSLWCIQMLLTAAWCVPQVSFSEGGPGSNSTGSEVASMSSQLPDTPNSMVSSPIEAWADAAWPDCTEHTAPVHPTPAPAPDCTKQPPWLYFDTVKTIMGFNHSHPL